MSACIEDPMFDQSAGTLLIIAEALTRLLVDICRKTESSSHRVVVGIIQTVVDRSVAKALNRSFFKMFLEQDVYNKVLETHFMNAIVTSIIVFPAFTAPAAMVGKTVVEKVLLEEIMMENRYEATVNAVKRPDFRPHVTAKVD